MKQSLILLPSTFCLLCLAALPLAAQELAPGAPEPVAPELAAPPAALSPAPEPPEDDLGPINIAAWGRADVLVHNDEEPEKLNDVASTGLFEMGAALLER